MHSFAKNTRATVIPVLRYRDAPAVIEWLRQTFGFEKNFVVPTRRDDRACSVELWQWNDHAWSVLKNETEFARLMKQPDEIGGAQIQSAYLVVTGADAVYARARPRERRSLSRLKTKTTVVATSVAMTWKVISGASAPMTRGDAQSPDQQRTAADRKP